MRLFAALAVALACWAMPVVAQEHVERLARALQLDEVIDILVTEGSEYGRELNDSFLNGEGGVLLQSQIEDLYDATWMRAQLIQAFRSNMDTTQLEQAAIFFESELGQAIVSLENSARRAFSDEAVEEFARMSFSSADQNSPPFRLVDEYIRLNDLIEQNVQGTLSADYNFYLGMAEGSGVGSDLDTILNELLARKDETEADTREWLYSFLLMAYQPLSEAEMRENIAFSRTETGRALNQAFFDGFDDMYDAISYQMGTVVAQAMRASDL